MFLLPEKTLSRFRLNKLYCYSIIFRSTSFKEDEGTWKGNEDGKVINKQPQRVIEGPNAAPQGGYIVK